MSLPKLVRDRIPDLIRETGRVPHVLSPPPSQLEDWLVRKLQEEVDEYKLDRDDMELVDIYEVLRALWARTDSDITLDEAAAIKRETVGGFDSGVVLQDIQPGRNS